MSRRIRPALGSRRLLGFQGEQVEALCRPQPPGVRLRGREESRGQQGCAGRKGVGQYAAVLTHWLAGWLAGWHPLLSVLLHHILYLSISKK